MRNKRLAGTSFASAVCQSLPVFTIAAGPRVDQDWRMRNNRRSHGLWALTAPPAPETALLTAETAADIVVIGGGYTGLSAALHLAEGGACVALLEASEIGFGGSGRNVGLVNAGMWHMPDALPDALRAPFGERLLEQLGRGPQTVFELIEKHDIECGVERAGTLHYAVGRKGLEVIEARAAAQRTVGRYSAIVSSKTILHNLTHAPGTKQLKTPQFPRGTLLVSFAVPSPMPARRRSVVDRESAAECLMRSGVRFWGERQRLR
ncbi:hypothetical protein ABIB66_008648 [Bradyrhizobium sp. F1.13.3]